MSVQALTFDFNAAQRSRDRQLYRVHANPAWFEAALVVVHEIASHRSELTTDDVWRLLDERKIETPPEPRALANVMLRAKGEGWIAPTDRTARCTRPTRNAGSVRIWASRIVAGVGA